jgi:hypothetical protein
MKIMLDEETELSDREIKIYGQAEADGFLRGLFYGIIITCVVGLIITVL